MVGTDSEAGFPVFHLPTEKCRGLSKMSEESEADLIFAQFEKCAPSALSLSAVSIEAISLQTTQLRTALLVRNHTQLIPSLQTTQNRL